MLKEIARQGNIPIYAVNTLQVSLVLTSAFIKHKRSQNCCPTAATGLRRIKCRLRKHYQLEVWSARFAAIRRSRRSMSLTASPEATRRDGRVRAGTRVARQPAPHEPPSQVFSSPAPRSGGPGRAAGTGSGRRAAPLRCYRPRRAEGRRSRVLPYPARWSR